MKKVHTILNARAQEILNCRTMHHDWQPFPNDLDWKPRLNVSVAARKSWRCASCTSIRREIWSVAGKVVARDYDYADDYKLTPEDIEMLKANGTRSIREAFRMEIMARDVA